jgi:hypothetical protein
MLFATRPRLFSSRVLVLLGALAGLASGCQSSRPSFSFQPAPGRITAGQPAAGGQASEGVATVAPAPAPVAAPARRQLPTASGPPMVRKPQVGLPKPASRGVAVAEVATAVAPTPAVAHRRALGHRAHPAAEAGLGTTVFGILGLITLPIALLGLLLSGGGVVWAVVAGAAALAILVAYLDPFGR